ncbi:MAG TPA: tRNA adenosine(34) deaminase TadA [Anaerolineae bacterium]|nr:tRNA adenosine(34) deaminase TadA [Anaerolineae bacterium]
MNSVLKAHITNRDLSWMRLALVQAQKARALGEVPVGAIAISSNRVVGAGFNRKECDQTPLAHAEIIALQQAATTLGSWRLSGVTLYCTLEPCPMCAGAMLQARLKRLVYGARDVRFGADGSVVDVLRADGFNHRVDVLRGVLEGDSAELLQTFFQSLRDKHR